MLRQSATGDLARVSRGSAAPPLTAVRSWYTVTWPFFQRFRPSLVPTHTLPSLAASTDVTEAFDKPCSTDKVTTAVSRKRPSPLDVATHTLPSRSS